MADYAYNNTGTMHFNLYLACCKFGSDSTLEQEWKDNRQALISFIRSAHFGVKGIVRDKISRTPIHGAHVHLEDNSRNVSTSALGEYWRLLPAGKYKMIAGAYGYKSETKTI